ncbi:AI-2E family transporter [Beijerinckia indica]|uniref:Permease n=1 Tax=Beijerinckia indica subsp. indica (strain ATCC 9039 / DSM 1715 / NCIMB 8712) TaxID=395963 RepID=B2IG98_BEII9|nr:AI-2E family transporter [Beijerinckia indica]ACB97172.1 protein of unknown function UPF0118 [Beijerinckia indica subsp. indica ATCC 9039]
MDNSIIRAACALLSLFLMVSALFFAAAVFGPMAFALLIMAIVWPLDQALRKILPRGLALIVTIFMTFTVVITFTSLITWGGGQITHWLVQNQGRLQDLYSFGARWLEDHDIFVIGTIAERFNVVWLIRVFQGIVVRANSLAGFTLLVFIFLAMGLLEADAFRKNLQSLDVRNEGSQWGSRLVAACGAIGAKWRRYMLMRSLASLLTGLLIWGFAFAVGLELSAAWGVMSFALNYIPFIGPLVATILPTLFALAQTGSLETALLVLMTITAIQFLIGSYLEPLFTGKALAISPFFVVFAVFFWSFLWGLPGTVIGVPIMIACLTICDSYPSSRWIAVLLSGREVVEGN